MKYLCIHSHFSLPPREDPFTGQMIRDADAAPFRNRYEQVTADCYLPNAVLGNFNLMSFDFAPRLLSYLETHDTTAYSRIISADRGNALATTFHPVSLPQLSRREKVTQVRWGLKAFEAHFGRQAAGLWLTNLAVDDETLDVLSECSVEFTLLSSEQIRAPRARGAGPYRLKLTSGREMAVFTRDHALSDKVAFELNRLGGAGMFAARYLATRPEDGLLLIATDGETYGHHHPGEEMFARYLLQQEALNAGYQVVPLAGFLRDHPPEIEAELPGPSSWRANGEDNLEERPSASWKAPLRAALAHLADAADAIYEREVRAAGLDPWALRDGYADVLTNRAIGPLYLAGQADRALTRPAEERVLTLLHAQAHRMAMFDSYAFSAEFNSVEVRIAVAHVAHAVSLIAQATGEDLSGDLRYALSLATDPRGERTATEIYIEIVEAQHM